MTTGKTTALTRQSIVGKVVSLLIKMLSMLVIIFLPRSKHLLIPWLQSPSAVIFSSVQSFSHVRLFVTSWITTRQASLSITKSRSSLRLMPIESVMPSSHLILCRPLLLLPPLPPSRGEKRPESFPMSQLFAWGGQSTRVSALASFLPKKYQGWSPSEYRCY